MTRRKQTIRLTKAEQRRLLRGFRQQDMMIQCREMYAKDATLPPAQSQKRNQICGA